MLGATAAAAAASGGTLFEYNRKNFLYDRRMRQETEYQIMDFRIKQASLWREDVRDIIGLTAMKMDTYIVVTALQLGFCVIAFCEGRLPETAPDWLAGCHLITLSGAFMYLMMSVWFAMHAMVTAKAYEVRLLTQLVRLPVPTWSQLEGARTYASCFEKTEPKQMFRVPFVLGTQEQVLHRSHAGAIPEEEEDEAEAERESDDSPWPMRRSSTSEGISRNWSQASVASVHTPGGGVEASSPGGRDRRGRLFGARSFANMSQLMEEVSAANPTNRSDAGEAEDVEAIPSADPWGLEQKGDITYELDGRLRTNPKMLRHLRLVGEAQQYWLAYDAFARVTMSCGTYQFVSALAYYVTGYLLILNQCILSGWIVVALFMTMVLVLLWTDMSLSRKEFCIAGALAIAGPCLSAVASEQFLEAAVAESEHVIAPASNWIPASRYVEHILVPLAYILPALWHIYFLKIIKVSERKGGLFMPTGFRSVIYVDIFGWIKNAQSMLSMTPNSNVHQQVERLQSLLGAKAEEASEERPAAPEPCSGPGLQGVHYDKHGRPVPLRSQAADSINKDALRPEDFKPTTFVPRELDSDKPGLRTSGFSKPGYLPWTLFWYVTALIIILWLLGGLIMLLQAVGLNVLRGHHHGLHSMGSLLETAPPLTDGKPLATTWPLAGMRSHGLACGNGAVVSLSRFGLFGARLGDAEAGGGGSVAFEELPPCAGTEGESLGDVALSCGREAQSGACHALVLHRQGQRLSACPLSAEQGSGAGASGLRAAERLAHAWLGDADKAGARWQEEITSIASADSCQSEEAGAGPCTYVETSGQRLVEMRSGAGADSRAPTWLPSRILQGDRTGQLPNGGSLHLVGEKYLGVLRPHEQQLELLDPKNGTSVGRWQLPEGQQWGAMCSTGGGVFLLTQGASPQLWRFPLPEGLGPKQGETSPELQSVATAAAAVPSAGRRKFRRPPGTFLGA